MTPTLKDELEGLRMWGEQKRQYHEESAEAILTEADDENNHAINLAGLYGHSASAKTCAEFIDAIEQLLKSKE